MTLLYLITAIFTMLSLVLCVRRVPRCVTVLQAVAFACTVALFIHYLAKIKESPCCSVPPLNLI